MEDFLIIETSCQYMNQLSFLTLSDFVILGADAILLTAIVIMHYINSKEEENCRNITVGPKNLLVWRYAFYGSVLSAWLGVYFLLGNTSTVRFIFYIAFPYLTTITLNISLPAWFCKLNKQMYLCNCDYYTYKDFKLVLVYGTIIGILLILFPLLSVLILSMILLGLIYLFIPKKEIEGLNYPNELKISDESQLQNFLMKGSENRKIIILIHSGCDFCELQVNELNTLPNDMYDNIRILDFTNGSVLDDFHLDYLNIERNYESMQFPATLIIDNGMSFDKRMGILSSTDMDMILNRRV